MRFLSNRNEVKYGCQRREARRLFALAHDRAFVRDGSIDAFRSRWQL